MSSPTRIARWTGVAYLALGVFGMLGFLIVRPILRVEGDPTATLSRLVELAWLAQLGIALELLIVIAQAATAVGFYALFRTDRPVAAFAVATFGMANATAVLASAAMLITASGVAAAPVGDPAATVTLLLVAADAFWSVGNVFFGLWLIPMGWYVLSTGRMPRPLGWILVVGGAGYVAGALLAAAAPGVPVIGDLLVMPATIGEFWMIGYLLIRGIRPAPAVAAPVTGVPEHRSV